MTGALRDVNYVYTAAAGTVYTLVYQTFESHGDAVRVSD